MGYLSLHLRHNDHDALSNHQPHSCLLNYLFRRRSKKTSKLRVTGLCVGNSPWPVNSPHKWPVTRKIFSPVTRASYAENVSIWWCHHVKSLWPCDPNWWPSTGPTLAKIIDCCLKAPSHYLNQCWLFISKILWLSQKSNLQHKLLFCTISLKIIFFNSLSKFPGTNELKNPHRVQHIVIISSHIENVKLETENSNSYDAGNGIL